MVYDNASMVANNILSRSFGDEIFISPMKLQKILYFVASEYAKNTGEKLLEEDFETWSTGPVLRSVYNMFKPFGGYSIRRYAPHDAMGNAYMMNEKDDAHLRVVLDTVWATARNMDTILLAEVTKKPNSAWDKAIKNEQPFLSHEDIVKDCTYKKVLTLPHRKRS